MVLAEDIRDARSKGANYLVELIKARMRELLDN